MEGGVGPGYTIDIPVLPPGFRTAGVSGKFFGSVRSMFSFKYSCIFKGFARAKLKTKTYRVTGYSKVNSFENIRDPSPDAKKCGVQATTM